MVKRVVILGGGTGGTLAANRLRRAAPVEEVEIVVVDQDDSYLYQPGLLFVPFGLADPQDIVRKRARQLHHDVSFTESTVEHVDLEANEVHLSNNGLELDIAPGTQTLIVGQGGAGKNTLAAVLLRLLDASAGTIELVGADHAVQLEQLSGDDVRTIIGWCAQDANIFDSTIEANVRLARPDASAGEIEASLRRARLGDWIDTLPQGLHTMVGEHGRHLSGGQRQRLALARMPHARSTSSTSRQNISTRRLPAPWQQTSCTRHRAPPPSSSPTALNSSPPSPPFIALRTARSQRHLTGPIRTTKRPTR